MLQRAIPRKKPTTVKVPEIQFDERKEAYYSKPKEKKKKMASGFPLLIIRGSCHFIYSIRAKRGYYSRLEVSIRKLKQK